MLPRSGGFYIRPSHGFMVPASMKKFRKSLIIPGHLAFPR
jgi:hypothetical protein